MSIPTKSPQWATDSGAEIVEPSTGKKEAGWATSEKPPAGFWNWWMNLVGQYGVAITRVPTMGVRQHVARAQTVALPIPQFMARGVGAGAFPDGTGSGNIDAILHGGTYILRRGLLSKIEPTTPVGTNFIDAAYGSVLGAWAMIYDAGNDRIQTATDGITWTDRGSVFTVPANSITVGVVSAVNRFVAVGEENEATHTKALISYKDDPTAGGAWTAVDNPQNIELDAVTYEAVSGNFVAVGRAPATLTPPGNDCYVVTSPDGITWTQRATPYRRLGVSDSGMNDVAAGNGIVVAVGGADNGTDNRNTLVSTDGGVSWSSPALPTEAVGAQMDKVFFAAGHFVAIGGSGGSQVVASRDGVTWWPVDLQRECLDAADTPQTGLPRAGAGDDTGLIIASEVGVTEAVHLVSPII